MDKAQIAEGRRLLADRPHPTNPTNMTGWQAEIAWTKWLDANGPALLYALEAAQRDEARLDFLLENVASMYIGRPFYRVLPSNDRAAIDAAMRDQPAHE